MITNSWRSGYAVLLGLVLFSAGVAAPVARAATLPKVTNVSLSPTLTNEFYLTATNITTSINGTNVKVLVYMDDPPGGGGVPADLPGPLIEVTPGQMVICHFKNNLTNNIEGATVHWHGIELDNDSDGTAVTQDTVFPGDAYVYRFVAPRTGLYWYHSHMIPGTTTFGGMYGPIIVKDPLEASLIASNVLPSATSTFPLVLSDISFTNGAVGKVYNGTNFSLNTLIHFCENSILGLPDADGNACGEAGRPGRVVLVNGVVPKLEFTVFSCLPNTNSAPIFYVGNHQRIRLQLFNASISRDFYLSLRYPCFNFTSDTNLYQIGGQGGLLDNAILNGGVQSGYDFLYPRGSIVIGTGMRSDVIFNASGNAGDIIRLVGNPLPYPWKLSFYNLGLIPTNYPVAFFVITNGGTTNLPVANGSPILAGTGTAVEDLGLLNTNILSPPPLPVLGTRNAAILFDNNIPTNGVISGPTINGYAAVSLDGNSGFGSWLDEPILPSALWARIGDVLQLAIVNNTDAMHPYHLHGFSMQPMSIYTANLQTNLYNFPYNQFLDTVEVYPGEAVVFRVKLEDRPKFADTATGGPVTVGTTAATGGGVGRWLMHCHIFLHGAVGMIGELIVQSNIVTQLVGPAAGRDSVILAGSPGAAWSATTNVPWLHLVTTNRGVGSTNIVFSYDANPGATRLGTLNVAGKTVAVTQAGTNYVKAPGPITALVTNGINAPFGVDTDDEGNVYFSDSVNGAVKKWTRTSNAVTTLMSGLSTPYGVGRDSQGNIYVAQFGSAAIRRRSATFPFLVTTLFTNNSTGVSGLAVDRAGNVYITVPGQNAVKKWTASTKVLSTLTMVGGLNGPYGVAVDVADRVYVADTGNNAVKRLDNTIGGQFWNTLVGSNIVQSPWGVAVDDGGNLYISDGDHNAIKRWSAASNSVVTLVSSGINLPTGIAVDSGRNVYFADWSNDAIREVPYAYVDGTAQSEPAEVTQDTLPVILPPTQNLLPPFVPVPSQFWIGYNGSTTGIVAFTVSANPGAARSGTLTVLGQPVTINQAGSSFAIGTTNLLVGPSAGSNTVAVAVVPSIATWSASTGTPWLHLPFAAGSGSGNVLFSYDHNSGPTRTGTLTINSRVVTVTQAGVTYVQAPGPLTTLVGSGLNAPSELTVDRFGNVLFSDSGNDAVKKWTPGSLSASTVFTTGLNSPEGIAVDGAGNIFVADFFPKAIKMWRASDSNVLTLVDNSPFSPSGLALDSITNVYWSNPAENSIRKSNPDGSGMVTVVSTNLASPYGLALDVAGAIYIADTFHNAIKKWNPVTSSLTTVGTNGVNTPWNVAVDGSGNVYVANGGSNNILKWVAASGRLVTLVTNGVSNPTGVAVDASQNLFIADFGTAAIKELPYAFVDPATRLEPATAGSDALPVVLPPSINLTAQFAPVSSQPWLSIAGTTGGVVNFNFTANTNTSARTAFITLLGQNVFVFQRGVVPPPFISAINQLSNGVIQMSFANGDKDASYSVFYSTNVLTPLTNWTFLGPINYNGDVWEFIDVSASNDVRFYFIRSP